MRGRWARHTVMAASPCLSHNARSILMFGLSFSYAWTVAARFIWGFLNGNIGVAKSYLAEICDATNMDQGCGRAVYHRRQY